MRISDWSSACALPIYTAMHDVLCACVRVWSIRSSLSSTPLWVLQWDNNHSSFLVRTLMYQARIAKSWEVENAQRTAREKANERRSLELQRVALKRALTQHVAAVSGVSQASDRKSVV